MLETLLRSDSNPCEPGKQLTGLSANYKARVNWFEAGACHVEKQRPAFEGAGTRLSTAEAVRPSRVENTAGARAATTVSTRCPGKPDAGIGRQFPLLWIPPRGKYRYSTFHELQPCIDTVRGHRFWLRFLPS